MNLLRRVRHMVLTAFFAFSICGGAVAQHKNFILVIDPGHGGEDPGAVSGRTFEKNLNLEIALALGSRIAREMPDVDVLYTRTDDRAVGLAARGDFANRAGADLFLSIHTNSNSSHSPYGTETYVMGMDKNEANLEVAKLENEVIKYEPDYTETYAGFDPSSAELSIIFGMLQYANFESSLGFARLIQKHYAADTQLRDRGAKQGPFAVLWKPTMPRVLTEIGFISNESDRRYMFSERGKEAIAGALFDAFREYKGQVPADSHSPAVTTLPQTTTAPPSTAAKTSPKADNQPPDALPDAPTSAQDAESSGVSFHIQLAATRNRIPTSDPGWEAHRGKVVERHLDGWYKYSLPYRSRREAEAALPRVKRGKFSGAFIVEIETNPKK